jgi:hypothetical protein
MTEPDVRPLIGLEIHCVEAASLQSGQSLAHAHDATEDPRCRLQVQDIAREHPTGLTRAFRHKTVPFLHANRIESGRNLQSNWALSPGFSMNARVVRCVVLGYESVLIHTYLPQKGENKRIFAGINGGMKNTV